MTAGVAPSRNQCARCAKKLTIQAKRRNQDITRIGTRQAPMITAETIILNTILRTDTKGTFTSMIVMPVAATIGGIGVTRTG